METLRRAIVWGGVIGVVAAVLLTLAIDAAFAAAADGTEVGKPASAVINRDNENYYMAVVLGAALAAGFGFLGGGYAVARVGAAALGAASERPELLARSIVLVALGEGIAVFGFVVALMILTKLP
ncbi:MAG TPA: ATP synthase subunit C [Planctomycetota bacterium]|nr:ATP synthase subunit C [Planctomycetota bacterium]HUV39233.1 ATP synthase subunit C [Planctomycetota bacterium]